jgi:predicted amidohydrolase
VTVVCCCQLAPRVEDPAYSRELTVAAVRRGVDAGAAIIVLPELATAGYVFESPDEVARAALAAHDEVFDAWSAAVRANRGVVVGGFAELAAGGACYNSAAIVDGDGVRAVYRKTHLWDREREWFLAGDVLPPVVETRAGRVGVAICYDLEFPEVTRHLAVAGAELIAVPTNWPLVDRPDGERPPEVVIAMAAARVNRVAIACCDRTGTERGQRWTEGSTIIAVDGWPVAVAGAGESSVTAELDLARSRDKRLGEHNDALGDRRPALYASAHASAHASAWRRQAGAML